MKYVLAVLLLLGVAAGQDTSNFIIQEPGSSFVNEDMLEPEKLTDEEYEAIVKLKAIADKTQQIYLDAVNEVASRHGNHERHSASNNICIGGNCQVVALPVCYRVAVEIHGHWAIRKNVSSGMCGEAHPASLHLNFEDPDNTPLQILRRGWVEFK